MASSDEEDEVILESVTNYYFEDGNSEPVSFAVLPVLFDEDEKPEISGQVFLHGTSDGGLQKVFKQVTGWRLGLQDAQPDISVLSKEGKWIRLLKPRKIYEEETARTILVTVYAIQFLRKNPESSEKSLWVHLNKNFSFDGKPTEDDFMNHHVLIQKFIDRDEKLAKCQLLPLFLKERSTKRISSEDGQIETDPKKGFIVDDNEVDEGMGDNDGDDSDEEADLFDSVCAICDNGGELLCCEGRCLRSFHATRDDGLDSNCKSLGYSRSQVEAIQNFLCKNCQYKRHQCFACGKLGSSDKSAGAEVFSCVNATCGHFYHPKCVARLLYRDNEAEATECQKKIAAGESFMCPVHKCVVCGKGENKEVEDSQFAVCRRCPKAYHRRCLPREISFDDDDEEEDVTQRAWDDLLPHRILIYCLDHEIDEDLGTPIRNHIRFPEVLEKKKVGDMEKSKGKVLVKRKIQDSDSLPMKKRPDSESMPMKKKIQDSDKLTKDSTYVKPKKVIEKNISGAEGGYSLIKSYRSITEQVPESKKKVKSSQDNTKPNLRKADGTVLVDNKTSSKEKEKLLASTVPPSTVKKSSFPVIDSEAEKRIMALMEKTSSCVTLEGIMKKRTIPSTHAYSGRHMDKIITYGKVEGSVEAIRTALKKVEDGGSIEDAKAVCEPEVLKQLLRWNGKLKVYLSPFLHGVRYTSFGRHFTKVDKLKEIVDKLQWYIQNGDTIVDFCCGSNDFSILMKEKLDASGKNCSYKNFDVIQPKNDFNFEKRDWMTVQPKELPTGSQLIMGLNPPFGVKASLANKFIDKALTFRPKLVILIVPPETERLDQKRATKYDLIWEDKQKLSGKSFYLPGSVDVYDKQIEQWNNTPPPLYLWSRTDWTLRHRTIASKQGHIDMELNGTPSQDATPLERTMDEHIEEVHENNKGGGQIRSVSADPDPVSTPNRQILSDTGPISAPSRHIRADTDSIGHLQTRPETTETHLVKETMESRDAAARGGESNKNVEPANGKRSPESHRKKRRGKKNKKRKAEATFDSRKADVPSDMSISPRDDTREMSRRRVSLEALEPPLESNSYTPSARTSEQFSLPTTVHDMEIDEIAKKYAAPSSGSRNWSSTGISGLDYAIRDDPYGRKPPVNEYEGYGRMYGGTQGHEDLSHQSRYSLSGSSGLYHPSPSLGLSSSDVGSSAMQRYAIRLDDTNYTRPGILGPRGGVPGGSSIYGLPGMRRDVPSEFAPGPQHTYPRPGSSGWLND